MGCFFFLYVFEFCSICGLDFPFVLPVFSFEFWYYLLCMRPLETIKMEIGNQTVEWVNIKTAQISQFLVILKDSSDF